MLIIMVQQRPRWWPRFSSTLRSTAVTARVGTVLAIAVGVLFLTGLLSHYQYEPWSWLPEPAKPVWGYRLTQGIHVATGIATIPLLLFKLWSIYPNKFRFPPIRSIKHAVERLSVAILVSTALVQVTTRPSEQGPPRKFYSLNDAGRAELEVFWAKWTYLSTRIDQLKEGRG